MRYMTYICYDYHEIEDVIKGEFPVPKYEFVADQEASNDTTYTFEGIDGKDVWDEWDKERWEKWLASEGNDGYNMMWLILDELVRRGILVAGNYLIDVSW